MGVALEFISLIIPIEKIEEHYPGGFAGYKMDHLGSFGGVLWHDDFIVRDGAMNSMDIESLVQKLEEYGLKGIIEKDGKKYWGDFCVVGFIEGKTLQCDWLVRRENGVAHEMDKTDIMIGRSNYWDYQMSLFKPAEWVKKFRRASAEKQGFREMRAEIFKQTAVISMKGEYFTEGRRIEIDNLNVIRKTYFYKKPKRLVPEKTYKKTRFSAIGADCLETAELLQKAGYDVCMLNMANRQNPGGGVLGGAGAQEENIFRRSNILLSLYQFADYAAEYGINRSKENSYPLDRNTGGIYSKEVTVFRGSEGNGYCLRKEPFKISIVSVPAINRPKLDFTEGEYFITKELIEPSKEKIRTILRICGEHKHDCLVFSAFGCGAFRNPPKHSAKLFKEVFREEEFLNRFKFVVFAIIDDHNSWKEHNPEGNLLPFFREFEEGEVSYGT